MNNQIYKMSAECDRINKNTIIGGNVKENDYDIIYDPKTLKAVSLNSTMGKKILQNLISEYKRLRYFVN